MPGRAGWTRDSSQELEEADDTIQGLKIKLAWASEMLPLKGADVPHHMNEVKASEALRSESACSICGVRFEKGDVFDDLACEHPFHR